MPMPAQAAAAAELANTIYNAQVGKEADTLVDGVMGIVRLAVIALCLMTRAYNKDSHTSAMTLFAGLDCAASVQVEAPPNTENQAANQQPNQSSACTSACGVKLATWLEVPDCARTVTDTLAPILHSPVSFHLPLTRITPVQLGKQPECLTASVDSSREVLQPGRIHQPATADKAADAQQKRSGLGEEAAPSTCAQRGRVSNSNQEAAPAKRAAKASPLDPIQPIFLHPDVKDANSCHTLRLPPPSHRRAP
jgi:hypothetical protein